MTHLLDMDKPNLLDGLAGLGLKPKPAQTKGEPRSAPVEAGAAAGPKQNPLVTGSATARALYKVLAGEDRVIIVKSPPGGGKTEMITTIAAHLANRLGQSFTIGVARREQGAALAHRLVVQIDPERVVVTISNFDDSMLPRGVRTSKPKTPPASGQGVVTVRTIASLRSSSQSPEQRLLLVDEAYQSTFESVAGAASKFAQVMMVGDPGQIGPVIRTDVSAYEKLPEPPHHPAPVVFARHASAAVLSVDRTYRLGETTIEAISPMYDFAFTSARPRRTLSKVSGEVLAEIEHIEHPEVESSDDEDLMWAVAHRASSLVGSVLESVERDGTVTERTLERPDVAVIVALNTQVSMAHGMLANLGMGGTGGVTVGTADRLQGGEWPAVVALDPMCGSGSAEHNLTLGRLCTMTSRHSAHLSWVHDGTWRSSLPKVGGSRHARTNRVVRELLTRFPAS